MSRIAASVVAFGRVVLSFRGSFARLTTVASGIVATRLAAFLTSVVIARTAGASTFGEFTLFTTVFTLTSEIGNSFDVCYLRQVADLKDVRAVHAGRRMQFLAKLAYSAVVIIAAFLTVRWVAEAAYSRDEAALVVMAVLSGSLSTIFSSVIAWYQALRRFDKVALMQPVFNLTVLLAVTLMAVMGWVITQAGVARVYVLVSGMLATAVALWLLADVHRAGRAPTGASEFIRTGVTLLGSNALILASTRMDVLLLPRFVGYEEVGQYGAALRIALLLGLVQAAATMLILPSAVDVARDPRRMRRFAGASALFVLVQGATAAVLIGFRGPVVSIVFGPAYASVEPIVVVLVLQSVLTAMMIPFQAFIQCGRRPKDMIYIAGCRLVIVTLLLVLCVPAFGLIGAGYAMVGTSILALAAMAGVSYMSWRGDVVCRPSPSESPS